MKFLLSLLGLVVLFSCSSGEECKDCEAKPEKDTLAETEVNDMESAMARDTAVAPTKEMKENHAKIVKKYGEQWDFCTCIVKNDSITDAFEKKLTPQQEEKLMARWESVDNKCKELTTFDNTTPEERAKHEKRVNKCLKENGLKK